MVQKTSIPCITCTTDGVLVDIGKVEVASPYLSSVDCNGCSFTIPGVNLPEVELHLDTVVRWQCQLVSDFSTTAVEVETTHEGHTSAYVRSIACILEGPSLIDHSVGLSEEPLVQFPK